jgi:hypothetical protein
MACNPQIGSRAATLDALERLQTESRQYLHSPLDALLPATLDRAFEGEM